MNVFAAGLKEKRDKQHLSDLIAAFAAFPLYAIDYAADALTASVCSKAAPPDGVAEGPAEFLRRYGRQAHAQAVDTDWDGKDDSYENSDGDEEGYQSGLEYIHPLVGRQYERAAAARPRPPKTRRDLPVQRESPQHWCKYERLSLRSAHLEQRSAGPANPVRYERRDESGQLWLERAGNASSKSSLGVARCVARCHLSGADVAAAGPAPRTFCSRDDLFVDASPRLGPQPAAVPLHPRHGQQSGAGVCSELGAAIRSEPSDAVSLEPDPAVPSRAHQQPDDTAASAPDDGRHTQPPEHAVPSDAVDGHDDDLQFADVVASDPGDMLHGRQQGIVIASDKPNGASRCHDDSGPSTSAHISSATSAAASPVFGPYGQQQVLAASGGAENSRQGQPHGRRRGGRRSQRKAGSAVADSLIGDPSTGSSAPAPRPTRPATH